MHFWRPLIEASSQLGNLQQLLDMMPRSANEPDQCKYIWNSVEFFTQKAYLQIIDFNDASPIF
jgi:hypothetical protein